MVRKKRQAFLEDQHLRFIDINGDEREKKLSVKILWRIAIDGAQYG